MQITLFIAGLSLAAARGVRDYRPAAAASYRGGPITNPEEWVNTLGGTKALGGQEDSFGNVLPEVTMPWGFDAWTPVNTMDTGGWFFHSEARNLYGVRCTHQPSPWISDYGQFRMMAHTIDDSHMDYDEYAAYNPAKSQWSPYYWNASVLPYAHRGGFAAIELAPTTHGALLKFSFQPLAAGPWDGGYNQTRRVLLSLDSSDGDLSLGGSTAEGLLVATGASVQNSGGVPSGWGGHYFYATLGGGADGAAPLTPGTAYLAPGGTRWLYWDFPASNDTATDTFTLRVATSLISPAQAQANHAAQVAGRSLQELAAAAKAAWHTELSRVTIADPGAAWPLAQAAAYATTFYSSLFRAAKFPRALWESDYANGGAPFHWSPYTNEVHSGVFSTDQGHWDAYRTTYSLLALWRPDRFAVQMEGWLNAWREGGWVPQWSSPGYRGSMTGTMSDVTMSEAIVKLPHCPAPPGKAYCVNASGLYAASRQNAFVPPVGTPEGRECLLEYTLLGYVPSDGGCDAVVSRTLNYLHSDHALSHAARVLGLSSEADVLAARAANWSLLLDPATGFMRARQANGNFTAEFDEFAWGPSVGYTEAGPWQYRVEVPYDPAGLKAGLAALGIDGCEVVQAANTLPSAFHAGGYGGLIHEMSEMAVNCWGQWELNNQPVWALQAMQLAFDSAVTGKCAQQAQGWLRQSVDLFSPADDMFPGDEDNGSMGAWFIQNALGLYPLSPSSGDYILSSPLFANVSITIDGGAALNVVALNQGPGNVYVTGVTWNGAPVQGMYVAYADLMQGGTLQFSMSSTSAHK